MGPEPRLAWAGALGLALGCAGAPPQAPGDADPTAPFAPVEVAPEGLYAHRLTGFELPERAGAFVRTGVTHYDPMGFDVSGHYVLPDHAPTAATVYHYPATADGSLPSVEDFVAHFERARSEIAFTPGGTAYPETPHDATINGLPLTGLRGVHSFPRFHGFDEPVESTLYLFAVGNWYIKFRFTYPETRAREVAPLSEAFIESFVWTLPDA